MTRVLGVIPARMAASRFPGKPLALLCGRPMLEHVFRRSSACRLLTEVLIATCDTEIFRAAANFGATAVMTSAAHERASERVAEVSDRDDAEIVVMVQGDEPMIQPAMIATAVTAIVEGGAHVGCVNLAAPIRSEREVRNPNTIKTVMDRDGLALYFSRSPIPSPRSPFEAGHWFKQVCVIAFRRDALRTFRSLPQGPLERAESIDMLRFLEHGIPVRMVLTEVETHAVDTPDDLRRVEGLMAAQADFPADSPLR